MQVTHERYIKGLSIAVIVLAGIGILGTLIGALVIGALGSALGSMPIDYLDSAHHHGYTHGYDYYYGMDNAEVLLFLTGIGGFACVFALICCGVTLVAGIMGLRAAKDPSKLGVAFGWSIAGAVLAFLGCGIPSAVLLIIIAVFAYKDKSYYSLGGQPDYGEVQATYPYGTPQPPAQPPIAPTPQPGASPVPPAAVAPAPQPVAAPVAPAPSASTQPAASVTQDGSMPTPREEGAAPTTAASSSADGQVPPQA